MTTDMLWYYLLEMFGKSWETNYGAEPGPLVRHELNLMDDESRTRIAASIREWGGSFPPTIPQLLQMGEDRPSDDALIAMVLSGDQSNGYANELRKSVSSFDRQHMKQDQLRREYKLQLAWLKRSWRDCRLADMQAQIEDDSPTLKKINHD